MLRLRNLAVAFVFPLVIAASVASCGKDEGPSLLQPQDLEAVAGVTFDKNSILDVATFRDMFALDANQVQLFLLRPPYRPASFLSAYQSNGVRAADAVARVSQAYALNPLALLARVQMVGGLVGEPTYPSDSSRVEFLFGCGCTAKGQCDPALGGFDAQIDCLGRSLKASLDEIAETGTTAGGFGPGIASRTLDGKAVTPVDASTAALYQNVPIVGDGTSGLSLFWNIYQMYARHVGYGGPLGFGAGSPNWIGDPCKTDAGCSFANGKCATNYPNGLCTVDCKGDCPSALGRAQSFCAVIESTGYCLPLCNPTAPFACREGYACREQERFGVDGDSQFVCVIK